MQEQEKQTAKGRDLYEWVQSLVGSVLVVVAIFTFVIRMMGVDGHSMLNTLQHGDRLLVVNSMLYHDYKYGDIVILRKNGVFDDDPIVKRVIAVEGQTVDIDFAEGIVYVDGEALEEDYIREPTYTAEGTEFPLTVPEGSIFVMGDNRNGSSDSRDYRLGTVDTRYVIGKAAFLIFPGGVAFLDMRAVSQHDGQKLCCQTGGDDGPGISLLDQQRKPPGMVNMSVGYQHVINRARCKRQGAVVFVPRALLQPAVDEDALATHFQTVAASGNCFVCAKKRKFHLFPPDKGMFVIFINARVFFTEKAALSACPSPWPG